MSAASRILLAPALFVPVLLFAQTTGSPVLVASTPANGATGVPTNASIVMTFDRPIGRCTVSLNGSQNGFTLNTTLLGAPYTVVVQNYQAPPNSTVAVVAACYPTYENIAQPQPVTFSYQTGSGPLNSPLSIVSTPPALLPGSAAVQVTFNRALDANVLSLGNVGLTPNTGVVTLIHPGFQLSNNGQTLTLSGSPFPAGT
jgi:hypothetical protein